MKKIFCIAVVVGLMVSGFAYAQAAEVQGTVVDINGAAVEGARVSLRTADSCVPFVYTDANGMYVFNEVPAGTYTIHAGKSKVGSGSVEGVEVLEAGVTAVPTITLVAGGGKGGR